MQESRKVEALRLSEELLADIEYRRIPPMDMVRKANRLARLLDDGDALKWLKHEISGFEKTPQGIPPDPWAAALRSNRVYRNASGDLRADTRGLGELQVSIDSGNASLSAAADANVSLSSANPYQSLTKPTGNALERYGIRKTIAESQALLDKVIGTIHNYVSSTYQELRFGAAVETAFEAVRSKVDTDIASIIPSALPMLNTALENASTNNPVQWQNAASACRDLIKAAADSLRPAGPDRGKVKMGEENFINRLVDWVNLNSASDTKKDLVVSDLEFLGKRLDSVTGAGHKGAHRAKITKEEASRYIVGTYLLLGDILSIKEEVVPIQPTTKLKPVKKSKKHLGK